jgi:oxygen-independent coproporphyrinogen III oxidase
MKIPENLITKYNKSGPRYTSYPPVPFWQHCPTEDQWIEHIQKKYDPNKGIDLYIHIPFCESLCYYCGCNRIITKNHDVEEDYIQLLLKEWATYQSKLKFTPQISSLHFGGGTPTFLSPENLDRLIQDLTTNRTNDFLGSIEIDPRTCSSKHIDVLVKHSIRRISLGIQDFNPIVQKSIHRDQAPEMVGKIVQEMRLKGIQSINFDLIYGLPNQSIATIKETIDVVCKLKPDLIAFYSYAHLPERIKNQQLIKEEELPNPALKRQLYEEGKKLLLESGYAEIGMDHFALESSYLYQASLNKNLKRNFMGYVDKKSNILIGLGPSSISDSGLSFIQNQKELKHYKKNILEDKIAIETGHTQNQVDLEIQNIIQELMCKNEIDIKLLKDIPYGETINEELLEFEKDQLLLKSDFCYKLTYLGKAFTRNIAMSFDYYLREKQSDRKFSQTI